MAPRYNLETLLNRRELLGLMGAAGAAFVAACGGDNDSSSPTATMDSATGGPTSAATNAATNPATNAATTMTPEQLSCVMTPELTEGPFFVDERLDRSDIRTDPSTGDAVEGVPLKLTLVAYAVQNGGCTPLQDATIDVWHCDAGGLYSDVAQNNTVGQQFLRGLQTTDKSGMVTFTTIYPGWYMGRTVHIHFKLRQFDGESTTREFTSQLFFDDALTGEVFANAPYNTRGERDTRNANDGIYGQGGDQLLLSLTQNADGYGGTFNFGVAM
jgi:protocatechuate 3,4-dioxygenase beta subunit